MAEYVQIPPDSTGKLIRHSERIDVNVTNVTSDISLINKGDIVTGDSSSVTATFIGQEVELGQTIVYVQSASGDFTAGETLSTTEYSAFAEVQSQLDIFTPTVHLADPDTPSHQQKVNVDGAAFVRYIGGNLEFDAFGKAMVAESEVKEIHSFVYGDIGSEKYGDITATGGTIAVNSTSSQLVLTTNTTSGSLAQRTTHEYYPYTPGIGSEVLISAQVGDTGKSNVVRRWGLYDDNDGVYFELSGSSFYVGVRTSTSGTPVDTKVSQSVFNGDRLEDANINSYLLDVSKYNLYWVDYQWLGVGKIRFGTYSPDGTKIILHTVKNPNANVVPYMSRGSLPLRIEQYNEGVAGSTSEFSMVCAAISSQKEHNYGGKTFEAQSNLIEIFNSSSITPLISVQPPTNFGGKDNRITYYALDLEYVVSGSPVVLETYVNGALTGSTFSEPTQSYQSLTVDKDATEVNGGAYKGSVVLPSGGGRREIRERVQNAISNFADGTSPTVTFGAKSVLPTTSSVFLMVRWKEVQ